MPSEKWMPVGERLAGVAGKFLPPTRTTLIQNCGTPITILRNPQSGRASAESKQQLK